ncbi:MAG: hypothetical protein GEU93_05075 [Propionibacteriales bacterium]|nr:hypothetical protein [Propionibacteriales bacterium]
MAHDNHGSTPAAWAVCILVVLAFCVGGVALVLDPINWPMFVVGMVLLPVALIVGKVMAAMGMGAEHDSHA